MIVISFSQVMKLQSGQVAKNIEAKCFPYLVDNDRRAKFVSNDVYKQEVNSISCCNCYKSIS